jgi:hypothetical protein
MHLAAQEGHFSIGVFLFRDGADLPLHDHERMSVYSRYAPLLFSLRHNLRSSVALQSLPRVKRVCFGYCLDPKSDALLGTKRALDVIVG